MLIIKDAKSVEMALCCHAWHFIIDSMRKFNSIEGSITREGVELVHRLVVELKYAQYWGAKGEQPRATTIEVLEEIKKLHVRNHSYPVDKIDKVIEALKSI